MSLNLSLPIIVAVADEHDAGLRFAAAEALRERRPLTVVHVVPPPHGLLGPGRESVLLTFQGAELAAENLLQAQYERALAIVGGHVPVRKVLGRGPVVDTLLESSREAATIVVQHRRESRLSRVLTGSTAAGLAARAPVPVISVPEVWAGPRPSPSVTVGLGDEDLDDPSHLLGPAFAEAENRGACLTVLHAWYLPPDYPEPALDNPTLEDMRQMVHVLLEDQVAPWRHAHPDVDVRVEVTHVRPIDGLLRASGHCDLLVVSRRRSHGLVHLGFAVRTLVRDGLCPVLIVGGPGGRQGVEPLVESPGAAVS
jgi:nucleotide-binding universal stress UspA family protein